MPYVLPGNYIPQSCTYVGVHGYEESREKVTLNLNVERMSLVYSEYHNLLMKHPWIILSVWALVRPIKTESSDAPWTLTIEVNKLKT